MPLLDRTFARKAPPAPKTDSAGANLIGLNAVRDITFCVRIGGAKIPFFTKWKKEETAYSPGSTCTVEVPRTQLQSMLRVPLDRVMDIMKLSQLVIPLTLDVSTKIVSDGTVLFDDTNEFSGVIDTLTLNRNTGLYTIQARSYAQVLLNAKTNDPLHSTSSTPLTSSQAVKQLVAKYGAGLKSHVDNFTTNVAKIYKENASLNSRNTPVWDLLQSFAQHDGADLFVKGDTVFYVRPAVIKSPDITELKGVTPKYTYDWEKNILDLEVVHSPMFAHDVTVQVISTLTRTGKTVQATKSMSDAQKNAYAKALEVDPNTFEAANAKSQQKLKRKPRDTVRSDRVTAARVRTKGNYSFHVSNVSQEDCDRIALQIMEDISRKEFIVKLKVLGQPDFNPRQIIKLVNSGSEVADQAYAIKSISTGFTMPEKGNARCEGYVTEFMLVNHHVQSVGVQV